MTNPPSKKTIYSEYPENSDTLSRDLENHIKAIIKAKSKDIIRDEIDLLYKFLKKHRLDIESECKKNGWMENSIKDFAHSLNRALEFSHEYLIAFPKDSPKHLVEQMVESSEELLFFLNNEVN